MRRAILCVLLCGCGGGPGLVPVEGRVLLDGRPVREVVVTFTPLDETPGSGSIGSTDAEGRFALTDVRGSPGVYVGTYRVSLYPAPTVAARDDPADVVARGDGVPAIYIDPNRTPLRALVPPGGGTVEVFLTGSGQGATTTTTPRQESP